MTTTTTTTHHEDAVYVVLASRVFAGCLGRHSLVGWNDSSDRDRITYVVPTDRVTQVFVEGCSQPSMISPAMIG
jgi:hypothetical protein